MRHRAASIKERQLHGPSFGPHSSSQRVASAHAPAITRHRRWKSSLGQHN